MGALPVKARLFYRLTPFTPLSIGQLHFAMGETSLSAGQLHLPEGANFVGAPVLSQTRHAFLSPFYRKLQVS